ncbi:hypothetical protein ACQR1W_11240 [Bradyrhizobium sp. HKCCYLS1011]|uniref:hypothetical protein n=1 Tax=Bradyrhizobium sp. HKCCYLS1011 TaxID=3420733 RepID=UPI003EBCBD75
MIDAVGSATSRTNLRSASQGANDGDFGSALSSGTDQPPATTSDVSPSDKAAPTVLGSGLSLLFASPQEEQAFASNLSRRLREAGVDTSHAINLTVGADGEVKAETGTKDADKIDAVFAADPALANEYRKISNTELSNAIGKQIANYMKTNSNGHDAIWQAYANNIATIKGAAGELSLNGGTLQAAVDLSA